MSATLWTVENWSVAWREGFLPWLRANGAQAWQDVRPTLVVVPTRTDAYHAKALALDAGFSPLALHFVTPVELREKLSHALGLVRVHPLREHLRLLLAAAAEKIGGAVGTAIAAAPDALLRATDVLGAGGWTFHEAGPAPARPVVAEFARSLRACGFSLPHETDRELLAASMQSAPVFARAFFLGFDAAHWPLWPLLAAAAQSTTAEATICLRDPRTEAQDLDATWSGTWEETFGAAAPLTGNELAAPPAYATHFLVGHDTTAQARAIVQQALAFLADPACTRLGILLPGPGALARRVAALLADFDVPHHDGLAQRAPGPFETSDWPAWLALQESPRLPALLRFLRASPAAAALFPEQAERILQRAFSRLLLDGLDVLAAWLDAQSRTTTLAAAVRALPRLPERTTLADFLVQTAATFALFGWNERTAEMQRLSADWAGRFGAPISRRSFLRWLGEVLASSQTERAPAGRHPYSRAHLLPASQAEAQTWSHLIVAGLNEGVWPPPIEETGWLGEDELTALNARIRTLNQRATRTGRQGEGHWTVAPGRTLCLGPRQRRELVARQFLNTLESATAAVAVSASLIDEAAPDRLRNPSEFFTARYFAACGKVVSQATLLALRDETMRWLAANPLWSAVAPDATVCAPTLRAFGARRSTEQFGEYEFARLTPPARPLRLAATDWEKALASPAAAWLKHVLGVEAPDDPGGETPWSQTIGSWVHRWLAAISDSPARGAFAPLPSPAEIVARVQRSADDFRARVAATLQAAGHPLPDWWTATWQQAKIIALALARRVATVRGPTHLATEWRLADTAIPIADSATLHVHGFIDLLLAPGPAPEGAWIIDYKTGDEDSLTPKKADSLSDRIAKVAHNLRRADGLQLALYALALPQAQGVSRLTRELPLDQPQLTPAEVGVAAQRDLWLGLCRMQDTAIFGAKGKLRDDYSFAPDLPLATLRIDASVLAEKWTRTHPRLAENGDAESP
jgi:hypothetical protein